MTSALQPVLNSLNSVILGKNNQIKIKHMTEKELFELQAKSLEELLKEARKVQKSLSRIKEKNKNNETLHS